MTPIEHLRELAKDASEPPWTTRHDEVYDGVDHVLFRVNSSSRDWSRDISTAKLIAAMRTALPQLLAVVDEVRKYIDADGSESIDGVERALIPLTAPTKADQ